MGYLVSDRPTEFTGIGPLPGWLISRRTENARSLRAARRPRRRASSCLVVLLASRGPARRPKRGETPLWWLPAWLHAAACLQPGTVKDTFINRLTSMRTGNRSLLAFSPPSSILLPRSCAAMRISRRSDSPSLPACLASGRVWEIFAILRCGIFSAFFRVCVLEEGILSFFCLFVGGIGLFEELSSLKFQLKIEGLKESIVLNNARLVLFRSDRNKSIVFKWTLFLLISWRARDTQLFVVEWIEYYCLWRIGFISRRRFEQSVIRFANYPTTYYQFRDLD